MVAILNTNPSIANTLNYNEKKVAKGLAECIGSGNYPLDLERLSYELKIQRFIKRAQLNQNIKRNCVHISLNFAPEERLSREKLIAIAGIYLDRIGFGKQPYLIYEHHDAGHPHVHIVTINIDRWGRALDQHNLVIRKCEPARKEIEKSFGLIKAAKTIHNAQPSLPSLRKIQYGRVETRKAIGEIVSFILQQYKYTSLSEFNALLRQYNIMVQRCKTFSSSGLVYSILTPEGKTIGVPIKASNLYPKPTLSFLEDKFKTNIAGAENDKLRIGRIVENCLSKSSSISQMIQLLQKYAISTVVKRDSKGNLCELYYIDHKNRAILAVNAIGEQYRIRDISQSNELGAAEKRKVKQKI